MSEDMVVALEGTVVASDEAEPTMTEFGAIKWLVNQQRVEGAEQTFGLVSILPERHNPLHYHPNCEELLYVLAGECDHRLNDAVVHLRAGDVIVVPRGVRHNATCTSWEPLRAIVSFSSGDRQSVMLEGDRQY